jgi:hypothetical protein
MFHVAVLPVPVNVGDVESTTLPVPVDVVTPVPPLATASVPANVTAPDDAVDGVNPVVPALNVVTPVAVGEAHEGKPPDRVRTYPFVLAANKDVVPDPD